MASSATNEDDSDVEDGRRPSSFSVRELTRRFDPSPAPNYPPRVSAASFTTDSASDVTTSAPVARDPPPAVAGTAHSDAQPAVVTSAAASMANNDVGLEIIDVGNDAVDFIGAEDDEESSTTGGNKSRFAAAARAQLHVELIDDDGNTVDAQIQIGPPDSAPPAAEADHDLSTKMEAMRITNDPFRQESSAATASAVSVGGNVADILPGGGDENSVGGVTDAATGGTVRQQRHRREHGGTNRNRHRGRDDVSGGADNASFGAATQGSEDGVVLDAVVQNPEQSMLQSTATRLSVGGTEDEERSAPLIPEAFLVTEEPSDRNIVYAEPALPWWKLRRVKHLVCVMVVIVAALAVALGVTLTRETMSPVPNLPSLRTTPSSLSPSVSISPTMRPTTEAPTTHPPTETPTSFPSGTPTSTPSMSSLPSYSPTSCWDSLMSNPQRIELPLEDPRFPKVALSGRDAVVVVAEGRSRGVAVVFYVLEENGEWRRGNPDWLEGGVVAALGYYGVTFDGKTALVRYTVEQSPTPTWGSPSTRGERVNVYEKNIFGDWARVPDAFPVPPAVDGMIMNITVDGDLACMNGYSEHYVYHRVQEGKSGRWEQVDTISTDNTRSHAQAPTSRGDCIVEGNIVAVNANDSILIYRYDKDIDGLVLIQELSSLGDHCDSYYSSVIGLSKDQIAFRCFGLGPEGRFGELPYDFWNELTVSGDTIEEVLSDENAVQDNVLIYSRDGGGTDEQPLFSLRQQLNSSGSYPAGNLLAIDSDVILFDKLTSAGTIGSSVIYSNQNGGWQEIFTMDLNFDQYELSGRVLLVTKGNNEVYSFNLEDCTQPMPTQAPSISLEPTPLPTTSPTFQPSPLPSFGPSSSLNPTVTMRPTVAPSSSLSPTEICFKIEISIVYDNYPSETSWYLRRVISDSGFSVLVTSSSGSFGDTSHIETVCLKEGNYKFTIYDPNGLCCSAGNGYYSISFYGERVAVGSKFMQSETVFFTVPITPSPSTNPSVSLLPTTSQSPLPGPTLSPAPTSCTLINVMIVYDDYPDEVSWQVEKVDDGDDPVVASHQALSSDVDYETNICLQDGSYKFTIFDLACDGIMFPAFYNVTVSGGVILAGGYVEWGVIVSNGFIVPGTYGSFTCSETTSFSIPVESAPHIGSDGT